MFIHIYFLVMYILFIGIHTLWLSVMYSSIHKTRRLAYVYV
jgi:hypothetical protein